MENENKKKHSIDVRRMARVAWEHWWWFVIGIVLCVGIGGIYYLRKSPEWRTDAKIMLRQKEKDSPMSALSMLGLSGNRAADDEVAVLSSRGLMYQAIDALNLWDDNAKKNGWRWEGEYPNVAFSIDYSLLPEENRNKTFSVYLQPDGSGSGYNIHTRVSFFNRGTVHVANLDEPVNTVVG